MIRKRIKFVMIQHSGMVAVRLLLHDERRLRATKFIFLSWLFVQAK